MTRLRLRSKQWIVDEQERIIIGEGRSEILATIEKTGSINQTAKIMGMSYRGVWAKIRATEKYFQKRLVDADRKTGTRLTEEGKLLLEKYLLLKRNCIEQDDEIFHRIFETQQGDGGKTK